MSYNANSDNYKDITGFKCDTGLTCTDFEDTGVNEVEFQGVCKSEKCNGKGPNGQEQDNGTHKVTICHRTCSETNPWVRITIDDDAWTGNMCGHESEHDVWIDCNKEDYSAWGPNHKDYLIYDHGTREDVCQREGFARNSAEEKAYWKNWERACPYVRNGHCCSWHDGTCCGLNPKEPVCGNGLMEEGETCDDGNTVDGDGCDSNCQFEVNQPSLPCPGGEEPSCGTEHKVCTHKEDSCCDDLDLVCSGYVFHKKCQPKTMCLEQLYDCSGRETECCGGMVCQTLGVHRKVCDYLSA